MANHAATKKDVRQSTKRRERNRYYGKTTRNAIRDIKALEEKAGALEKQPVVAFTSNPSQRNFGVDLKVIETKEGASEKLPEVSSMIDKLARRGIIHKNKAANLKRKLTKGVNTLAK